VYAEREAYNVTKFAVGHPALATYPKLASETILKDLKSLNLNLCPQTP